ncbi:MAG: hypothetical protein IEMM0008_1371 [bacterium]|nr:MAG: hypothetical protein IEMM0008_1371 [bacterium]
MKLKIVISVCLLGLLVTCSKENENHQSKAQTIVDKAINAHGGEHYNHVKINFDFRDKSYEAIRKGKDFTYTRSFTDSVGTIRDTLSNKNGFIRHVDDLPFNLSDEESKKYADSVNSVIYFALMPYNLNDPAVIKEYMGEATIKGKTYHKIFVTFRTNGGGKDHQDEFMYWFNIKTSKIDYMAYNFHNEGGGTRFRVAYNPRIINGITFLDYINYKGDDKFKPIQDMDKRFLKGELKILSKIELKNISVKPLKS